MADIEGIISPDELGGANVVWSDVGEDDNCLAALLQSGEYQVECQGDWSGGLSVEIKQSTIDPANTLSIDATNLTFTADGTYGVKLARGWVKPAVTGGNGSAEITIKLTPIKG